VGIENPATGWSELVFGREWHSLKSSGFRGAQLHQLSLIFSSNGGVRFSGVDARIGKLNTTKYLSFVWAGPTPLLAELRRPIKQVSLEFPIPNTGPKSVTLWRSGEEGLRLCTEMHDVAGRMEVGVLNFEQVSSHRTDERIADVASAFQSEIAVSKLIVHESGTSAESGLILKASNGDEIVIIAGAHPYSLAVLGVPPMPHIFEPEYQIGHYMRVPIT
jgi:hypothetical protein